MKLTIVFGASVGQRKRLFAAPAVDVGTLGEVGAPRLGQLSVICSTPAAA